LIAYSYVEIVSFSALFPSPNEICIEFFRNVLLELFRIIRLLPSW